ncbi:hypothetical protein HGRIS_011512 [Hohenbuehelia grisea]|uniref:Uncharacterized protein n=1 Tax=Hohenbuehelia grisea TaxID=104357 RepID=A0ABR3JWN9_9AGAR
MPAGEQILAIASIVVAWTQGIFTILFAVAVYLVWHKKRYYNNNRYRKGLALVGFMYIIATIAFALTIVNSTLLVGSQRNSPDRARLFGKLAIAKTTIQGVNCTLADLLLIWRAWLICGRDRRVAIFPGICLVGLTVSITGYYVAAYTNFDMLIGNDLRTTFQWARSYPLRSWGIAFLSISCTINVAMTALISWKLIIHHRFMRRTVGYSRAWIDSLMIIESGALYSFSFVIYLILFVAHNNAEVILLDLVSQFAGIVPTLIMLTLAAGLSTIEGERGLSTFMSAIELHISSESSAHTEELEAKQ